MDPTSYFQSAVTVHALLLSLEALLVVNSVKSLTDLTKKAWDSTPDEKKSSLSYISALLEGKSWTTAHVKTDLSEMMYENFVIGTIGVLFSLSAIFFGPLENGNWTVIAFTLSMGLIVLQLVTFFLTTSRATRALKTWIKKIPTTKTPAAGEIFFNPYVSRPSNKAKRKS